MSKAEMLPRGRLFDPAMKLEQMQALPLEDKIWIAKKRIVEWHNAFDGKVYVSFSGGKDSTVLLHLARSVFKDIPAVFIDTGLEYPEIRDFVSTIDNVEIIRPKIPFTEVLKKYGYPVIGKDVSRQISDMQIGVGNKSKKNIARILSRIPKKWKYLIDSEIKISDHCCTIIKKDPARLYEKRTGRVAIIGTMASESRMRTKAAQKASCNTFDGKRPMSRPLTPWFTKDVWEYIKKFNLPYSKIYDMGYERTGCMFCAFGAHLEKTPNRFQKMQITHPKLYEYCMEKLGMRDVLRCCQIPSENQLLLSDLM